MIMRKLLLALFLSTVGGCTTLSDSYQVVRISTHLGDLYVWLYEETPAHRQYFIDLTNSGYFDDYSFNRVIEGFVAQGGCPDTPEGFAYSIHLLEPEFRPQLRHVYGTFAAGRDNNPGKLSAGCQFYVVHDANGIARLDDNYTIYGFVFSGMEVVDQIVAVETDESDEPLETINLDIKMVNMTRAEIEASGFRIPD
ncbi:MAG: peptidylprolyl isomerase [Pseudohongiellaceae bacterium]